MSEPVEDEAYFYVVMRYILQNPVKAGMVKSVGEYPYSSYADFFGSDGVIDCDFPMSLQKKDAWYEFINADTDAKRMDMDQTDVKRLTQEQAEDAF
ncbi:MAG: hypothetical protein MJ177_09540 [Clostridia bacterium]|nr:hypothetical protein [Clostridia bacterium]